MGNIIVTGEVDLAREPRKHKVHIPYRDVEFEIPDDLKEGPETDAFIRYKLKQELFVWYLNPFGVSFSPSDAIDAVDFGNQLEYMFDFDERRSLNEEEARLVIEIMEWNKMSVGQKMFCCLTFPQNLLSEFLFSETNESITKLIQNRFGNIYSNLIIL